MRRTRTHERLDAAERGGSRDPGAGACGSRGFGTVAREPRRRAGGIDASGGPFLRRSEEPARGTGASAACSRRRSSKLPARPGPARSPACLHGVALALLVACAPAGGLAIDRTPSEAFASSSSGGESSGDAGSTGFEPPSSGPTGPSSGSGGTSGDGTEGSGGTGGSGGTSGGPYVSAHGLWRYLVEDPGAAWADPGFEDSTWPEGQAPIGGGGAADLSTTLDPAGPSIAARLRVAFEVDAPSPGGLLLLQLRRADGVALLLNGAPLLATNLAGDAVEVAASGDEGRRYLRYVVAAYGLVAGVNFLAAEIHRKGASAPFALDLQLEPLGAVDGLQVQLRTRGYNGEYGDRNVGAIWVERPGGEFVRTLALWAASRREHLVRWRASSGNDSTDAITSATRKSHVTTALTWDLRDANGVAVAPGDYLLRAEFTEDNSNKGAPLGPLLEVPFVIGGATAVTIPGSGGFRDVTVIGP
ncbi:MAG: DUF2271 domain-containing protein [Nannocystaceae bacterium]